jgi:hypothetical protein
MKRLYGCAFTTGSQHETRSVRPRNGCGKKIVGCCWRTSGLTSSRNPVMKVSGSVVDPSGDAWVVSRGLGLRGGSQIC